MKASELRIGNYVYFHGDVEEINMVDGFGIIGREEQPLCSIDEFEPIPLTEEWLLKFGFEFDTNLWHNQIALYLCSKGFNYNVNFFEHDNLHTIQYVHQLQNLYFALTGEELEIKSEYEV